MLVKETKIIFLRLFLPVLLN